MAADIVSGYKAEGSGQRPFPCETLAWNDSVVSLSARFILHVDFVAARAVKDSNQKDILPSREQVSF